MTVCRPNETQAERAFTRCPECGARNPSGRADCRVCGTSLPVSPASTVRDAVVSEPRLIQARGNASITASPQHDILPAPTSEAVPAQEPAARPEADEAPQDAQPYEAVQGETVVARPLACDLAGRIIAVESSQMEPPDFDLCRALTKALWVLIILASPLLLFSQAFLVFGLLAVVILGAGVYFLSRIMSPTNLLLLVHLGAGRGRHRPEQVPVRYFRVREHSAGSEAVVRMKGLYDGADVSPDDLVSFWGRWRRGILVAKRGYNHRTGASVAVQESRSWIWLVVTLFVAGVMALSLYGTWLRLAGGMR